MMNRCTVSRLFYVRVSAFTAGRGGPKSLKCKVTGMSYHGHTIVYGGERHSGNTLAVRTLWNFLTGGGYE